MPQASEEDRDRAGELFGHRISDAGPIKYLEARGWTRLPDWEWRKPSLEHEITEDEAFAIGFLIDEWDWGGVAE